MSTMGSYDNVLYSILCNEGNIVDFFDKIFEFLYKKTDFLKIKTDQPGSVGLQPGEAEKIVRCVFCKYMELAISENKSISEEKLVPLDAVEETVVTTSDPSPAKIIALAGEEEPIESRENYTKDSKNKDQENQGYVKISVMDPDCYNGAQYDDYSWAQTIKDADIRIKVSKNVTSGKQVRVDIQQTHLRAEILEDNQWTILKESDLPWKINVEESTWTLVPREHIHICLQKIQERWWDSFLVGEPKIDLKTIDSSMPYEDLDEESQAKIDELMYNQHLKRLGKPSIQQSKLQNILKDAWDAEGSPFKGLPFDPAAIDIQNSENF